MRLTGLHILLTYRCILECDHCFVWGGPRQTTSMTVEQVRAILRQAYDLGTVEWVYFEGGEPFLYYPVLVRAVQLATSMGFRVGVVTNAFWANSVDDALIWLKPFAEMVEDLAISSDDFHGDGTNAAHALAAAGQLRIPTQVLRVGLPADGSADAPAADDPESASVVMFRGRAADTLADKAPQRPAASLMRCENEDLRNPGRVHVDPLGYVHICQGMTMGNLFQIPLKEMVEMYVPERHPIVGALLKGGPLALARVYGVEMTDHYADACHMCYEVRRALRKDFPEILAPDQMYGA
ncbi:MAG: radical SAM protein [Anaerolineales bacterium]